MVLDEEHISNILAETGEKPFRLNQIRRWVYNRGMVDFHQMSDLSAALKERLAAEIKPLSLEIKTRLTSRDKSTDKLALLLHDGQMIEMVILRNLTGRVSVCISSQVGCAVGCAFCATGQGGICRNLTAEEIADQVLLARVLLKSEVGSRKYEVGSTKSEVGGTKETLPSNVIIMGMGEPFLNYDAIVQALDLVNRRLNIGGRRLTVSTVGIVPGIRKFASENLQVNLAVSLHSVDPEVRSSLIPINDTYPLPELKAAVENYIELTRRKVFFEYIMLSGVNDSFADAQALAAWLPEDLSHVNLIRYNQVAESEFDPSSPEVIAGFQKILQDKGIPTTLRHPMGDDIQAACGQLVLRKGGS